MKRAAFTLIELLVVIAIIAILAAILFPVFAQAREKARQTSCLSNCKQIGTAQQMYVQDYDEVYPLWGYWIPTIQRVNGWKITWVQLLQPYVKNMQIFKCPSDTNDGLNLYWDTADAQDSWKSCSYWQNAYVTRWSGQSGRSSVTLSEFNFPATTVTFCEGPTNNGQHTWPGPPSDWCGTNPICVKAQERHSGGMNSVFADSHAKWYRPSQFKSTNTDAATDPLVTPGKPSNDGVNPWWRL